MGDPLCAAGSHTAPTSGPLFLSYAGSIAPRGRPGGAVTCGSPATTSDLVTTRPTLPFWPVFGMVMFVLGWPAVCPASRRLPLKASGTRTRADRAMLRLMELPGRGTEMLPVHNICRWGAASSENWSDQPLGR